MSRQNKNKSIQQEPKQEVIMTETETLDTLETEIDKARLELEKTKSDIEAKKSELKFMSAREVSEDEMVIIKKQAARSEDTKGLKAKIEAQKEYDNQKVTGKFINRRSPGKKSEKLTYMKYADDPVKWYEFEDGKVYTLPRGFADQLNGGTEDNPCYYTPHFIQKNDTEFVDPNKPESSISNVDTSNKKYAFVPISF